MDINKICMVGYFDRVLVDAWLSPLYNARGITINSSSETFEESINMASNGVSQGVSCLSLKIIGESDDNDIKSEVERMKNYREEALKLERVPYGGKSRYTIATAQILIVRNQARRLDKLMKGKKCGDDITKSFNKEASIVLLMKAVDIQDVLRMKYKRHLEKVPNIAIVEEVVVKEEFRQCRISTWLHSNLKSLVEVYGLSTVGMVLLTPGDFTGAAKSCGMTTEEYTYMLVRSYEKLGYKKLNRLEKFGIMKRDL